MCKCKFGHVFGKILQDVPGKKHPMVKVDLKNVLFPGSFDSVKAFTGQESLENYYRGERKSESERFEIDQHR